MSVTWIVALFSWKDQLGLCCIPGHCVKLGAGSCYTNDKTQPTLSLAPSPIILIYININNVISFLTPSFPFTVDLNDLLTLSSVFLSPPFLINTHTHLHKLTYNNTTLGPSTALHPTPGGVNLRLQTTSHTSSSFFKNSSSMPKSYRKPGFPPDNNDIAKAHPKRYHSDFSFLRSPHLLERTTCP